MLQSDGKTPPARLASIIIYSGLSAAVEMSLIY